MPVNVRCTVAWVRRASTSCGFDPSDLPRCATSTVRRTFPWCSAERSAEGVASRGRLQFVPIEEITVEELDERRNTGAVLLDVRNPDEYLEAHVPGVVLIPLPELDARWTELAGADVVHVICRSGARSARAVEVLQGHGVTAVNVAGGTLAWIESGRPVDTGPESTRPVGR